MSACLKRWLFFLLLPAIGLAQNPNLGTAGAQFLKIPVGAASVGLGGSCIGLTSDASAVFWNPVGISAVKNNSVHFSHLRWFGMFDLNSVALVHHFEGIGHVGLGLVVFSTDKMEITTETQPNGSGQFFDAQDMAFSLSYSRFLTSNFSAGVSLKYIYQRIWDETAGGVAFDIGTKFFTGYHNIILAMTMSNFGPDLQLDGPNLAIKHDGDPFLNNRLTPARYTTDPYALPLNFQFGVTADLYQSPFFTLRAELDAVHPNDNLEHLQMGGEALFWGQLVLRAGYKFRDDDEKLNLGAGIKSYLGTYLIKLDYAYSMYEILPDVHFISAGFEF